VIRLIAILVSLLLLASSATAADVCERGAVMEKLGPRPRFGSGLLLVSIELTFRTKKGASLTVKDIYLGKDQKFPAPGAVCTICYRVGKFLGVVMPDSNILQSITCSAR